MKYLLTIILLLGLCVSTSKANETYVLPNKATEIYIVPTGIGMYIQIPVKPVPKPHFRTPIRNFLWSVEIDLNKILWYSRYYRYKRLEKLLGPSVKVQQPEGD